MVYWIPQNNATFVGNYSFDTRNIVFADTGYAALDDGSDFDFAGILLNIHYACASAYYP